MKNDAKNHNKPIQGKDFEAWVEERARLIVENLYMYKKDKKPHYIPSPSEQKHYKIKLDIAEDFIRQIAKEIEDKFWGREAYLYDTIKELKKQLDESKPRVSREAISIDWDNGSLGTVDDIVNVLKEIGVEVTE